MLDTESVARTTIETPAGKKQVKSESGPVTLQLHDTDLGSLLSTLSPEARRNLVRELLDTSAAVPDQDLSGVQLIQSQNPGVRNLETFDDWSEQYDRRILSGESAIFTWESEVSPICPSCGETLYWHFQSGCEHEGDIGSWERGDSIQAKAWFDVSQTKEKDTEESTSENSPWRLRFLALDPIIRAKSIVESTGRFEDNVDAEIEYIPESEWDGDLEPASFDTSLMFMGDPVLRVKDDADPRRQARNLHYGLSLASFSYTYGSEPPKLPILCLTYLLCVHFGIDEPTFPHVGHFDGEEELSTEMLEQVITKFQSISNGVRYSLL
jgi:hypothetical protein